MALPIPSFWMVYRISSNNSQGWLLFFSHKKGRLFEGRQFFEGGDYFKHGSLEVLHWIFCFIFPLNQQMITNWTEHGLFWCSRFGSLITFQCQYPQRQSLNDHWWVLRHQTPLQDPSTWQRVGSITSRCSGKWARTHPPKNRTQETVEIEHRQRRDLRKRRWQEVGGGQEWLF